MAQANSSIPASVLSEAPLTGEETPLLHSLHEFEVILIVRFLTPKEKVLLLANLNRKWKRLITKHYAWSSLPVRGRLCLLSTFADFFDGLSEFTKIHVPDFPA